MAAGENIVEHGTDTADAKAKDQAFNVEAGALGKIKQARGIPILRHEDWFGETEGRRKHAGPQHFLR